MVFEIQQNSDVTFRLYDWDHIDPKTGKPRALQVDKAIACIDFSEGPVSLVAPVSYTHLDVYKRQMECSSQASHHPLHNAVFGLSLIHI